MAKVQLAAFITTNVDNKSINESFLSSCSNMLSKMFYTDVQYVTLELQPNVSMVRAASTAPMLNLKLFHNSDKVDNSTKHDLAKQVAIYFAKQIRIPEDRVLVLFIDTRLCNSD
ncbi:hypothetical protein Btru_044819 [Bulinus truncatus]|nr:hypothetical protein Btru_044819 [Bulinus truncatus]